MLKTRFWMQQRYKKELMEKLAKQENEKDKLEKKLLLSEMQRRTPRPAYRVETPPDSGISIQASSSG